MLLKLYPELWTHHEMVSFNNFVAQFTFYKMSSPVYNFLVRSIQCEKIQLATKLRRE